MSVDLLLFSSFARQSVRLLSGGSLFSIVAGACFVVAASLFFSSLPASFLCFCRASSPCTFFSPPPLPVFLICEEAATCFV